MSYHGPPPPLPPQREALPLQVPTANIKIQVRSSPEVYADLNLDWGLGVEPKTFRFHVRGFGKDAVLEQVREPSVYHGTASFERPEQVQNVAPASRGVDPGYGSGWGGESMQRSYAAYGGAARAENAWELEAQGPTQEYYPTGQYDHGSAVGAVPRYAAEQQRDQPYQSRGTDYYAPDDGSRRDGRGGGDRKPDAKQKNDRYRPHAGEKKRK